MTTTPSSAVSASAASASASAAAADAGAETSRVASSDQGSATAAPPAATTAPTATSAAYRSYIGPKPPEDDSWSPIAFASRGPLSGTSVVPPPTHSSATSASSGLFRFSDRCIHNVDTPQRYLKLNPGSRDIQCCVCETDINSRDFETQWAVLRCCCCQRYFHYLRSCKREHFQQSSFPPLQLLRYFLYMKTGKENALCWKCSSSGYQVPICPSCMGPIVSAPTRAGHQITAHCARCRRRIHQRCSTSRTRTDSLGKRHTDLYCKDKECIDHQIAGSHAQTSAGASPLPLQICASCKESIDSQGAASGAMTCISCFKKIHSSRSECYNILIQTDMFGRENTSVYCKGCIQGRSPGAHAGTFAEARPTCPSCQQPITATQGVGRCYLCSQQIHIGTGTDCVNYHFVADGLRTICKKCEQRFGMGGDGGGGDKHV